MGNVVVIGGGFGGTAAVRSLERKLPAEWEVTLISNENFMVYTPLLPEVVGASLLPGHAVAPLRKMLRRAYYYRAQVERIDLDKRVIHFRNRSEHAQAFDHLVLACGNVADIGVADGMADYALPLKTLGDALSIRNRIIVRLEEAELEDDPDVRRTLTTFIVVGGGSSGVEVAGSIVDFIDAARRYYRRTGPLDAKVIVMEAGERLVPEFPPVLGAAALKSMSRQGVEVHLNAQVAEVRPTGVKVRSGEWVRGGNVICTIGTVPNPLVAALDVPNKKGRISTDADLSVTGQQSVWAVGDCAWIVNTRDGEPSPPTAQFAVRQAEQAADNIARAVKGRPSRPFSYRSRGHLASMGHRRAIAHVFGIPVSGFIAWLMWRAVYLSMLPTFLRKLQVFFEWSLELLFPRDVTQLHLDRTEVARRDIHNVSGEQEEPRLRKAATAGS